MIDITTIRDILATYKKYDWILRRVLLTQQLKNQLGATADEMFHGVPIHDSEIDGAWFSRTPKPGPVAWEIRHLSDNPYALLEHIDENAVEFEADLRRVESRLSETLLKAKSA
ncbi:MAG: hypothetical protein ACKVQJ_15480 [Pyrinomonadaceae bacterium]